MNTAFHFFLLGNGAFALGMLLLILADRIAPNWRVRRVLSLVSDVALVAGALAIGYGCILETLADFSGA